MKEIEKLHDKNKEKMKEIEILNNKYEKLKSQLNSNNKKETTLKSKLIALETDNDLYLNKIHQYEEEVIDLKDNLENTVENLITTQIEFEEYKIKKEEEVERLRQQLQEEKNNVNVLMKNNKKEENEIKSEEQRNLSWNQMNFNNNNDDNNIPNEKKHLSKKIEIKEEDEKEHEHLLELGRIRSNRAMTMQKNSYNFGEVIANLRQRRERLAILNKKIKLYPGQRK